MDKELERMFIEMNEPRNAGEWELKQHFRNKGATVIDVSDNPSYWSQDIDLLVNDDGNEFSVEVKWDKVISKSGNLYLEILTDIDKNKAGWFQICNADFLYYGDSKNKLYYIFEMAQLRQFVNENKQNLEQRCAADFFKGVLTKRSIGYLVPLEKVKDIYAVLRLEEQA